MNVNQDHTQTETEHQKRPLDENGDDESRKKLCTEKDANQLKASKARKKHAILLGYYGKDYCGMQLNKSVPTIELELLSALHKAGLINENAVQDPHLIHFQRAARTDKSVSAVIQVVSLLLCNTFKIEDINSHLPDNIRVHSIKRVTKSFNSKGNCSGRTYCYLLPTQLLSQQPLDNFLQDDYRITPEIIERANEVLSNFQGTHKFHNFTSGSFYEDPRSTRVIRSFKCGKPFVRVKEFIVLTVVGQSFLLHQIRKMVGTFLYIMRGMGRPSDIHDAFKKDTMYLPRAPGTGLFLEQAHFEYYDEKFGNDGMHEKLSGEDVKEEVQKLRETIINKIIDDELENLTLVSWVQNSLLQESFLWKREDTDHGTENEKCIAENNGCADHEAISELQMETITEESSSVKTQPSQE